MLWALVGVALALPPAMLGPDGPMWVGPLPPKQARPWWWWWIRRRAIWLYKPQSVMAASKVDPVGLDFG